MSSSSETDRPRVAVVTGGHAFDVPGFHALFRSIEDADCYIQHLEDFVADAGKVRGQYDVVLFYTMPAGEPPAEGEGYQGRIRSTLEELGATSQGIFVLHHGILTYQEWPFWSELVGMDNREIDGVHFNLEMRIRVAAPEHPVLRGMEDWDMIDESYVMAEPDEGNDIILTVDHPQSMKAIAWTRTFKQARVFCFQSGHDNQTYVNPQFRHVIARGIQWCAGRI